MGISETEPKTTRIINSEYPSNIESNWEFLGGGGGEGSSYC